MKGFSWPGLQGVCKISLTWAYCHLSSIFHWYIWQTLQVSKIYQTFESRSGKFSQVSEIFWTFCRAGQKNPHRSVESSKYFVEKVRKILTSRWYLPNIVESRSGKTFPQIESRSRAWLGQCSAGIIVKNMFKGEAFNWTFLVCTEGKYVSFGTFNDPN